jgi:hypothetical protein
MTTHDNPAPNDDEWVSVNGHLDYHLGFIDSGIADDIEQRFGVFPRFGRAGGCVNMVLRLETGHVVNITDMHAPFLTALHTRGDSDGFTVAVYTENGFENGQPLFSLAEPDRRGRPTGPHRAGPGHTCGDTPHHSHGRTTAVKACRSRPPDAFSGRGAEAAHNSARTAHDKHFNGAINRLK